MLPAFPMQALEEVKPKELLEDQDEYRFNDYDRFMNPEPYDCNNHEQSCIFTGIESPQTPNSTTSLEDLLFENSLDIFDEL